jgi:hypothetical protein
MGVALRRKGRSGGRKREGKESGRHSVKRHSSNTETIGID